MELIDILDFRVVINYNEKKNMAIHDVCVDEEGWRVETYLRYLKIYFSINLIDLNKKIFKLFINEMKWIINFINFPWYSDYFVFTNQA